MTTIRPAIPALAALFALGCASVPEPEPATPSTFPAPSVTAASQAEAPALLVTRLGDDTIAVERVRRSADSLWAVVLLRSPQTSLRGYRVALDEAGRPTSMRVSTWDPRLGFDSAPLESAEVDLSDGSGIPFIDMVHWPFELMVARSADASPDTLTLPLVAGSRLLPFRMERLGERRFAATHPTRGTMTIETDAAGRMTSLDASRTTRALRVTRAPDADIGPLASATQLEKVAAIVERAKKAGARVVTGGEKVELNGGFYYQPTVLADVAADAEVVIEETFGPVLTVQPFDTEEEAIQIAGCGFETGRGSENKVPFVAAVPA